MLLDYLLFIFVCIVLWGLFSLIIGELERRDREYDLSLDNGDSVAVSEDQEDFPKGFDSSQMVGLKGPAFGGERKGGHYEVFMCHVSRVTGAKRRGHGARGT